MLWYRRMTRKKRPMETVRIMLISDLHLHPVAFDDPEFPNLPNPPMYFYTGREKLEKVVEHANAAKPDVLLCLGDVVHSGGANTGYDTFMGYWNQLDPSIMKAVAPGNHDYSLLRRENELAIPARDYVALKLGYDQFPINARSYFNQSFEVTNGDVKVKFIHAETNINDSGGYDNDPPGRIFPDTISWVSDEIDNTDSNTIVIYSHMGDTDIEAADKDSFYAMLDSKTAANQRLKIFWVYGHKHRANLIRLQRTDRRIEYIFPALIDTEIGKYFMLNIGARGYEMTQPLFAMYS